MGEAQEREKEKIPSIPSIGSEFQRGYKS